MAKKSPDDLAIENRNRAHARMRMETMSLGVTSAATTIGCGQGTLTKVLNGTRGLGLGLAVRILQGLGMDIAAALLVDPPKRFFDSYVPRPPDDGVPPRKRSPKM